MATLDVHQATTVASVREESGRVIARTILPTEAPAIVEWFRGMRGAVHVTFEEGTHPPNPAAPAPYIGPTIAVGVDRGSLVPSPTCPKVLIPQQYPLPSVVVPQLA